MSASEDQIVVHDQNDVVSDDTIQTMIMHVLGVQVMLDRDLATLYDVVARQLGFDCGQAQGWAPAVPPAAAAEESAKRQGENML